MIDRVQWIDKEKLTTFILNCQTKRMAAYQIDQIMH